MDQIAVCSRKSSSAAHHLFVLSLATCLTTVPSLGQAAPLALLEAFAAHRQSSQGLASERLNLQIAKEKTKITEPTFVPDLSAEATYGETDNGTGGIGRSSLAKAVASKNILAWWKYGPAHSASALSQAQEVLRQKDLTQLAFANFSQRFLDCFFLQRELDILGAQRRGLQEQIGAMRKRVRIGKSRQSDLLTFLSREKTFESLETIKKNSHALCLVDLRRQTGLTNIESLASPEIQPEQLMHKPASEVLGLSPSVQIFELKLKENEELLLANDRSDWPDLSAFAEYYGHRNGTAADDSKWGVGLRLTWPIYSGYQESGQKNILQLQNRQVELRKTEAELDLQQQLQRGREELKSLQIKTRLLFENLKLAKENQSIFRRDFNFGLVSNLDLLNSINLLIDAENLHLGSEKELQQVYWALYNLQQNWGTL